MVDLKNCDHTAPRAVCKSPLPAKITPLPAVPSCVAPSNQSKLQDDLHVYYIIAIICRKLEAMWPFTLPCDPICRQLDARHFYFRRGLIICRKLDVRDFYFRRWLINYMSQLSWMYAAFTLDAG